MKKEINILKEKNIDVRMQQVMNFAKRAGLNQTEACEYALTKTFLKMIAEQLDEKEFGDVMDALIYRGVQVMFKELEIAIPQDLKIDKKEKEQVDKIRELLEMLKNL